MRTVNVIIPLLLIALIFSGCGGGINLFTPPQEEINPSEENPPEDGTPGRHQYDIPDADEYLGGGHPIEGINYSRNNRSPYHLPVSLSGEDSIAPFFYEEYDIIGSLIVHIINDEKFHTMAIDDSERIYLGRSLYYYDGYVGMGSSVGKKTNDYDLCSFYFDGDIGDKFGGGRIITLTGNAVFSLSDYAYHSWNRNSMGYNKGYSYSYNNKSSLFKYGEWPNLIEEITGNWIEWKPFFDASPVNLGDWTCRRFHVLLPLPEERLLVAFTRDVDIPPAQLQVLDGDLEVLHEFDFAGEVTGFAFCGDGASTYVSTYSGLYCFTWEFEKLWDTTSSVPEFSDNIPVIADDGGILGCYNGVLRRVEPDGSPGPEQDCGAYLRPCVLNDGTIAVITESTIKYFDEGLNETGEVPLPSGADTGSQYTRPPLVDAEDNMALFAGDTLFIIDKDGNVIAQRTFDADIREIRLGPEHLFVALEYEIFRFPHG